MEKTLRTLDNKKKFNWANLTIIALTLALFLALAFSSDTFLSFQNIHAVFFDTSFMFFGVIGFTYLMIMGEIDLSVGSMYAFSGMFLGMITSWGIPFYAGLPIALVVCVLFGFINGFLVVRFKVPSMMITLGMMTALRGLASLLCANLYGYNYPLEYKALSKYSIKLGGGTEIFLLIIVMIVLVVILEYMLHHTTVFRKMYYVGENLDTARIYGIKSGKIKIVTFMVSAFTAAIGGILIGSRVNYAEPSIGLGYEFQALTAAVLGGASLFGGKGSILRAAVALFFLQLISNGMVIHNIEPLLQQIIVGIILIIAVWLDTRMNRATKS
jgi:ribose/xylose/arabinose/galactoside ABC-type transport system permease subunit